MPDRLSNRPCLLVVPPCVTSIDAVIIPCIGQRSLSGSGAGVSGTGFSGGFNFNYFCFLLSLCFTDARIHSENVTPSFSDSASMFFTSSTSNRTVRLILSPLPPDMFGLPAFFFAIGSYLFRRTIFTWIY